MYQTATLAIPYQHITAGAQHYITRLDPSDHPYTDPTIYTPLADDPPIRW